MKWIDVSNKVKQNIVEKLAIKVNVHWENTTIAEILLSEKKLYYRPWHVVDLLINNDSAIFRFVNGSLDILRKSFRSL